MTSITVIRQRPSRRAILLSGAGALLVSYSGIPARAAILPPVTAYRNPGCSCCEGWAERMKQAGFTVSMSDDPDLSARRSKLGIPADLAGCHMPFVGKYVIEGHVPPEDIARLLSDKDDVVGLSVPGMPMGSPGMEGGTSEPYEVLAFSIDGNRKVYARH